MSITTLVQHYGLFAIFLGAGIEGETSVVTGGLLAHEHLLSPWGVAVAAAGGSFVADQLFFAAGHHFRDHRFVRKLSAKPAYAKAMAMLERHPTGFIFFFRFLYGLRTVSPLAIGTSHVSMRKFVSVNLVAAAVWSVLFTSLGYVFGNGIQEMLARLHGVPKLPLIGGVLAVVAIGFAVARRRMRRAPPAAKS